MRQLSLGQRMLCEVIASFLHDPKVVFLDEPTIGLDVAIKDKIRKVIKYLNEEKHTTIVLTSHDTGDIEALCKRTTIIDKGKLIFDDSIEKLKEIFGRYRTLKISTALEENVINTISDLLKDKFSDEDYSIEEDESKMISIVINEQKISLTDVLNYLLTHVSVKDVKIEDVEIESVIKKIYER